MDCSLDVYKKLFAVRIFINKVETHYTRSQLVILQHYVTYLQTMSEEELPRILIGEAISWMSIRGISDSMEISEPYAQALKKYVFRVPTLKKLLESQLIATKEFISFLVRLLYHKPDSMIRSCGDQVIYVEKELRFLLAVLGDVSLMAYGHDHENVLAEFEGVANEAGSFVHSLFFLRTYRAFGEMDDGTVKRINLLKARIMKLSDVVPVRDMVIESEDLKKSPEVSCRSRSAYVSRKASVVESLLVLESLIRDLEGSPISDVKDQIRTLHQGLICFQSFIKETTSSPPRELEECYTRIGDLAHQAQHLIVSFLAGDAPSWYLFNRLIHVNHGIELCRFEIAMIYKPGGQEVAKDFNKQLSSSPPKRNTEVDDDIVGYEDKMTYVLDQLLGGAAEQRVISIFGMPGLGKTTLAKKLYNHPSVNYKFDKISWCVVSQTYSKRNVLANILIHIASDELGKDVIVEMEEKGLAEHIHKTLKGRRYLIVMDDIWDSNVCDELVRCFPDDGNGSRILFTTRNKDVAPLDCILYALPSLSDGQCWELLQKKVFNNQPCPPQLVESGKEIAANCRGMPLAAVVIAGILSTTDKEESAWEEVRRNLTSYILDGGDNSVMRILKHSYDHLPQHLKLCFLYLGVFLGNKEIPARHMMNMWIVEGFVHKENERDAAEGYLNELIDKSLVMVAKKRSDGGPKICLIHDLLRELCFKTCEEEKLMRFVNNKYCGNEDDRLRVVANSTTWMCCQYMRNHFGGRRTSGYQIDVPDMRLLRVLYFNCSFIYLTGIEYLVCLKYLVVCDLPPSISNLVNLEYLRVETESLVYIPSTIMKMKKLKHVEAAYGAIYDKDCNTSLTNKLEFLSNIWIRKVKDKKMLKHSPHLRILKCYYKRRVLYERIDLSFLTRLESLTLRFSKTRFGGVIMSLPSSITKLTLSSFGSKLCPKTMSMIGRLENLEILKLRHISFEENRWNTRDGEFEKLKYLKLDHVHLTRWNVGSSQHFPKLQQLVLHRCFDTEEIPADIGEIPTMQIIEVDWLLEGSARRIQQEQEDMGNEDLMVVVRPN